MWSIMFDISREVKRSSRKNHLNGSKVVNLELWIMNYRIAAKKVVIVWFVDFFKNIFKLIGSKYVA